MQSEEKVAPTVEAENLSARFRAVTPWSLGGALLAVVVILAGAIAIALVVLFGLGVGLQLAGVAVERVVSQTFAGMLSLGLMQIGIIAGVLTIARWYGGRPRDLLSLAQWPTAVAWATGVGAMAAVLVPYNLLVWLTVPETFVQDLRPFVKIAQSDAAWLALVVVGIGAPVSEELMFRGFLLPALAQDRRLGFQGAAGLSTMAWTALHFSYSAHGLVEVFLIGLLFCWLMWRFGSLWLPMVLHGLYNAAQMITMMLIRV